MCTRALNTITYTQFESLNVYASIYLLKDLYFKDFRCMHAIPLQTKPIR